MGGKSRYLAALVAAGGLAGCASGDGVAVAPGRFEGNTTLQTLSGEGIIPGMKKKEEISYRPRSPLVLPQKYELREPESTEIAAESNPAWPKDADVERKRKEKEFAALPAAEYDRQRGVPNNPSDLLLTAEEMEKGRKEGAGQVTAPSYDNQRVWLLPSEYQRKPSAEELEAKRLDAQTPEPRRRYLTEPPTGYRAPVAATTPEGKAAAEDAIKARQGAKPERSGIFSWLKL